MKIKIFAFLVCFSIFLTGCSKKDSGVSSDADFEAIDGSESASQEVTDKKDNDKKDNNKQDNEDNSEIHRGEKEESEDLGDDEQSFGENIEDTGAYDGYFEGESADVVVECVSGTQNAYKLEGTTLTFMALAEDSVYSVSGKFGGNIVIDIGDNYKFDLELNGFSLVCDTVNPIVVKSGSEVAIKAKKDTQNYIYDMRAAVDSEDETLYSGAIHSDVDLEIGGKGELTAYKKDSTHIGFKVIL